MPSNAVSVTANFSLIPGPTPTPTTAPSYPVNIYIAPDPSPGCTIQFRSGFTPDVGTNQYYAGSGVVVYVVPGAGFEGDSGNRFTVTGVSATTTYDVGSGTWEVNFSMPSNAVSVIGNFVELPTPTPTPTITSPPMCTTTQFFYDSGGTIYMQAIYCGGGTYWAIDYSGGSFTLFDTQCIQSGTATGNGTATEGASCA